MKHTKRIALLLAGLLLLSACGVGIAPTEQSATEAGRTESTLPVTELLGTEPAETESLETEAPDTDMGRNESLETAPPETEPPETQPPETEPEKPALLWEDVYREFPSPETPEGTTTLMVYMLGSDLESNIGAGSADLAEMASSGVDLSAASVLVYAGGSRIWHDAPADASVGSVLRLTGDGFVCEATRDSASMGKAETLTWFLDYCVENAPADHYALILWDHGSGPVIGFGKDMLFSSDKLTLPEMRKALENAPFGPDRKLDWVGFDACLMASAELACVWKDYADFMIASQEVEPSFGWAYSFLSGLGKTDAVSLGQRVTDDYYATCMDYYASKGYANRDTTLACIDLRYAPMLEWAVDDLFGKATGQLEERYDLLAACRVNTRGLARATTGSEYDLVDLLDLAEQLSDLFPEESERLSWVIGKMVAANASNTSSLSGMSLYFPFYNKDYYSRSWAKAYRGLGVFESYVAFLDEYAETWLSDSLMGEYETVETPAQEENCVYTLELTAKQAEHYASARFLMMQKEGDGSYILLLSGSEVTLDGQTLTARFDGNVIYAVNQTTGDSFTPPCMECDTVDGRTRYRMTVVMMGPDGALGDTLHGMFHLAVDKKTGEISISAFKTYKEETSLSGGKAGDIDPSEWEIYAFFKFTPRTPTRTATGLVRDFWVWKEEAVYAYRPFPVEEGLEFRYAPLPSGEYAIFFEIFDTQGNAYCSEPLEVRHVQSN